MSTLYVVVEIDGRLAALDAAEVQSVIELEDVYPVPRAPAHVSGLAAMRSQSLTVIACRQALELEAAAQAGERAPVVKVGGHLYALEVDAVDDVLEARSDLTPVPGGFGRGWERIGKGMIETDRGPVLLIDIEALIAGPRAKAA